MRLTLLACAAAASAFFAATPSRAAGVSAIYGLWVETLANGGGMITQFTPTTISAWGIDADGQQISPTTAETVTYRDLGGVIGVDFVKGGGILIQVRGPTDLVMSFPGEGAHQLKPWRGPQPKAPAAATPANPAPATGASPDASAPPSPVIHY